MQSTSLVARSLALPLAVVGSWVFLSCDTGEQAPQVETKRQASTQADLVQATPRWPDAIGGEERTLNSTGSVVASKKFTVAAEDAVDADAIMNMPGPGAQSTAIIPVSGIGFENGELRAYRYVVRANAQVSGAAQKPIAPTGSAEIPAGGISPRLAKALDAAADDQRLTVLIMPHQVPLTSLAGRFSAAASATFDQPVTSDRAQRIADRIAEVEALHEPIRGRLSLAGIKQGDLGSLWLSGSLTGELTRAEIEAVAADPGVRHVALDERTPGGVANTWDGTNVYNGGSDGINASKYWDGGFMGNRWNQVDGRYLRLGFVGDGFYFNHSIFNDYANGPWRFVKSWNCTQNPCTVITWPLNNGIHETLVASAAAGDATQGQIYYVTQAADRVDHSGVAKEARLYSAEGSSFGEATAALQKMIQEGVDVVNISRGGNTYCEYDAENYAWSTTVKNAHDAGVLVVLSAGNSKNPEGTCSITGWAQATSAFVVSSTNNPADLLYSTVARNTDVATGPMNAFVYTPSGTYQNYTGVLTQVTGLVPGSWRYGASTPDNFQQTGGTSLAAPQIAGAAMLVKEAFLFSGLTYIDAPGVLYATLLSMTDRAYGTGATYKSARLDPAWGGGRFQLRYFSSTDHPAGGAWGFDLWETTIYNGNTIDFPIRGTGAEPAALQQFKVYAVVFEQSWQTVADVDLYVRDKNCGAGSVQLGLDNSFDTKSMVRLGSEAAGKELCVRLHGYAVPPGGRRVVLASYFSVDTQMR